jgi:CRP/FNR family cyclic AMP-dependent transcriptional regulator
MLASNPKMQKVPVFHGLTDVEKQDLFGIAEEISIDKGNALFSEGAPGDALFVVLEGQVEVTKKGQLLARVQDGSVLGEMALIGSTGTRSASAIAATDVKVVKLSTARFQKLISADHVAALKVVANLAHVMCKRLMAMDERLVDALSKGKRDGELQDFQKILSNWTF